MPVPRVPPPQRQDQQDSPPPSRPPKDYEVLDRDAPRQTRLVDPWEHPLLPLPTVEVIETIPNNQAVIRLFPLPLATSK